MKKNQHLITIRGAKGKGGGGSTFEADDNMFARQSAAFIDAIAEGPIKGLVYGDASILVDEVRLRNVDQSTGRVGSATNFNNFTVITKNGEATQVVDADFFAEYPSASFMQSVGSAELLENEPQYHTISSGTFEKRETDYIKVTISTTGMSAITKKGDNKGDIKTTVVYFTIDFNWVDNSGVHHTKQMFDTGFNGKVSGKYAHTFGFNIETIKTTSTINDWSVKVKKLTSSPQSSDSVEVQNAIFVDTIEASIADKLEYPYTAYVGGVIDAEAFSSVPARGYEIDGKLIQIPSNHYPLDYNGRKLVLSNASAFAVGDVIGQTLSVSALNAAGTPEEGYTATASVAAHGVAVGETFKVTIATSSSTDEEFWEGTFAATATTTTAFTYTLNKPFNETTGEYKTLSGLVCGGTKTAAMFSGGLVEKKVSNTLYLRNVAAQSSAVTGTITNQDGDSGTVTSSEQVFIPANYRRNASTEKPTTLEQDWDGTFYQSWCNNPAWVFNDLVTNKIYGLGNYLTQAQVNKWELFQIGRYCDELVPAGVGAADLLSIHCTEDANYLDSGASGQHEPRFSANLVISGKQEAYKVLNDVTSIFRGMTYWLNGEAYLVQDSEKDPVYQFTNANVINGEFKYEGTANKTRTNSIMVNWNNPQDYYRSRTEIVELEENLQKDEEFLKPDETTAFGCTSRGQARRLGKWKLLTNSLNTNTVAFTTSVNAVFLRPGDIVQVLDQHKEGKSWGGRVSSSSSTSALNIDRKPTSFGNTSVESGYAAGDYRVTCSFVGYKAILAQDTATIGSTAYVRGAHLSSITTEEAAARQQDDSGDLVFVQWTPFTFTETETLQSVSNSGKTLTVASAFSVAPTHESIWVISRAAQATGKTKLEAKLFRVMSIAETDRNMFEVTGLEYNASKFDAVDKNEALTEYRTIYLPDSFKDVPAVTNIDAEPIIRAGLVDDSNINLISIEWDPATNSDGSLYSSLREYQVEYSTDNEKWTGVGSTPNTSIDLMGNEFGAVVSGQYYFRVYTINLNGKRSPYTDSGVITIDFNRAVGPSEGTVGNANWTINKIGNVSGDFALDSGKVTFSPSNLFHNDGKNEHAVTNQAQLDFTGLTGSNTDNNGANTGYVYFDHTASAFIAISHDEVSDQFYVPGASVFATATGTLTASTSATPKKWTGLDSTNFDGELAVDNVFKFTKNSTDYYHRVKRFDSDSVLHTYQPTRFTLIDSGNQAFSKPNFLADFNNDTIMGKVVKDGSGNYTLQKFGASQGESAFEVHGSNENFTFDANLNGEVTNESAFGCSFTVQKGTQAYAFAASGTAINTFGISLQARTGFDNESDIEISSTGVVTVGNGDMDAHTSATATLRLFDRGRASLLIADKILSFTKTAQGTAGENAKIVVVTPSNPFFVQFSFAEGHVGGESGHGPGGGDSLITNPAFITISAATSNTTANGVWSTSAGTLTNIVNTHTDPSCRVTVANAVDGMTVTYTLASADGGAADFTTLEILTEMEGLITPYLTNEAHVYPASKTGIVSDITGSGTNVEVYEGGDRLDYDGTGTARGKWKVVLNSPTGLSKGGVTSSGSVPSRIAVVANHTPATDTDNYSLVYTISGKTSKNVAFSFTKVQSLTKSKTGEDGSAGDGLTIAYLNATSPPNAPPTGSADATPGSWTATPSTPGSGYKTYVSFGTRTNNTGNFTWSTPSPITARDGDDGAGTEYIFAVTANSSTSPSAPSNSWGFDQPQSPWYDGAPSVTTSNKALWRAQRDVVGNPSDGDAVSDDWSGSTVVGRFADDGAPGTAAYSGFLTNENSSAISYAYLNETAIIYNATGGEFKTFSGTTELTADVTYGGGATKNGLTLAINSGTGVYTLSGASWSTESESFTLTAARSGFSTISKEYNINKNIGIGKVEITATGHQFVYNGTEASPSPSTITLTAIPYAYQITPHYLWEQSTNGGSSYSTIQAYSTDANISVSAPSYSAGSILYRVTMKATAGVSAGKVIDEDTVTIGRVKDGAVGTAAVNSRYPTLYRLNSSTRVAGNGSFADPRAGNTDWNYAVPSMTANGHEVYAMSRIFTSDGNSPHESAWPAAALYAKRVDGVTVVGVGTRQVNLYKKNDSSLSNDAFGSFADPKATVGGNAIESGWDYDVPTLSGNNEKVYVITRIFTSDGNSPQTANWTAPVIYAQRTDGGPGPTGPSGASSHVAYYLQSGYTPPATPSPGTDTTPGSYIATIPTAASGKSIWFINGTTPANSSTITWTAPQFYLGDFDFTVPGIFDNEFNLNLSSSGLGILGLTNNDYVNSQIVLPTFTTGTAVPNNSTTPSPNPLASQYTRTGVTPNQLYISNGTSWILQSINSNTEYAASDFDIANLGGDVNGYVNSNVNQTFIQAAITDFSSFRTRVGAGVPITANLITGVGGTITSNFGWTSMGVSSGATAASFSTTDGTNYTSNNITGQLLATHPLDAVTSASQTYTWSRTGGNVSGFALSAGASGTTATSGWDWGTNTGGTDNTFGSAATFKTVYVKHIASGFIITMSCYIIDTSSSGGGGGGGGGCFLPGTVIELEDGLGLKIETIEPGQEVKGGTITKRESFEVDYWYYLNDLKITAGHPVWIIDKGWSCIDPAEYYREHQLFGHKIELEPKQIEIGDMTTNGSVDIINRIDKKQTVWNITVDDTHTYYVDGILVHNSKE
jgi:predicted phage tail protein